MSALLPALKALAKKETVERLEKSSNNLLKSFESVTFQKVIEEMKSFGVNFAPVSGVLDSITASISADTADNAIKLADSLYNLINSEGGQLFVDAVSRLFNLLLSGATKMTEFVNNFINATNDAIRLGGKYSLLAALLESFRNWVKDPLGRREHDYTTVIIPNNPPAPPPDPNLPFQPPGGLK